MRVIARKTLRRFLDALEGSKDHKAVKSALEAWFHYEVMKGKRPLSLNMIRNLHERFDIPAEVLIQPRRKSRRAGVRAKESRLRRGASRKSS